MDTARLYIIIVTYNGMQWIERCLQSVPDGYPMVVVDNASTDGTVAYIQKHFPAIKLVVQEENLGFGGANNIGMQYALTQDCEGVFLLNQDAYLFPETLELLGSFSKASPEYGIVSPLHFAGDGYHLDRNFKEHLGKAVAYDFVSDTHQGALKKVYDVSFVNAAAWYVPKHTLLTIGGFDPVFYHYGEDDNYCQRALYHNLKIGVLPEAKIIHDRNQERKIVVEDRSPSHYDYMERVLKTRMADINTTLPQSHIAGLLKEKRKLLWKARLKLNAFWMEHRKKELEMVLKIVPQIQHSRNTNTTKGAHYLDINHKN